VICADPVVEARAAEVDDEELIDGTAVVGKAVTGAPTATVADEELDNVVDDELAIDRPLLDVGEEP